MVRLVQVVKLHIITLTYSPVEEGGPFNRIWYGMIRIWYIEGNGEKHYEVNVSVERSLCCV